MFRQASNEALYCPSLLRVVQRQSNLRLNSQVVQAGGLQTLLALLPPPDSPAASADTALHTATSAVTIPAPSKPASHKLQAALLQLLAAIMQTQQARHVLLAADSNASSTSCVAVLLNFLDPGAPAVPAPTPAAVAAPAGSKGAAVGKVDPKAKAAGKGKIEAPAGPPSELVPPFPVSVQLPAVQCLQVGYSSLS